VHDDERPRPAGRRESVQLKIAAAAATGSPTLKTLQEWEQGRRAPSGAARTLLLIAEKNPRAFHDQAGAPGQEHRNGENTGQSYAPD